jgi:uncharacterized membrane protein HdeD (DUF308 family)
MSLDPLASDRDLERFTGAWWLLLLAGVLGIAAGVVVLVWPGISLVSLAWVTGIFLIADAIFEFAAALGRRTDGRGVLALLGVLSLVTGILLVRHPIAGVLVIAMLLGIWLIAFGVVRFVETFGRAEHRTWNLVLAVLEVVAGIVIVAIPDIGVGTLAVVVGIAFVLRGIATAAIGWALHGVR